MSMFSTEWAWKDLEVSLNGARIGKLTKLTVKTARESEPLYGAGDEPFDINGGNKAYTGEMETYGTVIANMNRAARTAGFEDLTDLPWVITAHFKKTTTEPVQTVMLPNVLFDEFEEGGSQNDKEFKKSMPFKCLRPVRV